MINNTDKISRVRYSNLRLVDDKLCFKNIIFSGLAYRFSTNGILVDLLMICGGIESGKSDDLLEAEQDCLRIDVDFEDDFEDGELSEYEALHTFWQGYKFQGIGYMFDNDGILTDENTFDSGMELPPSRTWFSNGFLSKQYDKNGESYSWYSNGSLEEYKIRCNGKSIYNITINEYKQVEWIGLGIGRHLDNELFKEYEIGDDLTLKGKGIRDRELFDVINQVKKEKLKELTLFDTSITGEVLLTLDLCGIKKLAIGKNEFITDFTLFTLQDKYPACRVVREIY